MCFLGYVPSGSAADKLWVFLFLGCHEDLNRNY